MDTSISVQRSNSLLFIFILLLHLPNTQAIPPLHSASSGQTVRAALFKVYQDHRSTFFCAQPFSAQGKVPFQACTTCPSIETTISWMPIVPFKRQAQHLLCYREKICINRQGQSFKGLRCCTENNEHYRKMRGDLHNLVPELAFFKQQRRQYSFGLIPKLSDTLSQTPDCHFYVDKQHKIIEPSPHIRGMIARTFLYMHHHYYIPLSVEETALFMKWHHEYPPSAWEHQRNDKIYEIQGNKNPFVSS